MSGSHLRPYLGPLIALLVVLALGAGTVYAAIPNGSGTYYACLTKSSGVVRLINYPKVKCATGERFIKWNQQGAAGPKGDPGPKGDQGPKGDPGPAGVSGSSNWGDIANKPVGFADGVDDVGYTSATYGPYQLPVGWTVYVYADVPLGVDVELYAIPAVGGSLEGFSLGMERGPRATSAYGLPAVPADTVRRVRSVYSNDNGATTFKVRTRIYNTGIAPAALKKVAKQVRVGVVKVPKGAAKEIQRRIGR